MRNNKNNNLIALSLMGILGILLSPISTAQAQAKTALSEFQLNVKILSGCEINSNSINFGVITIQPNKQMNHDGGSFNVQCSKGVSFKIVSDSGITEQNTTRYIKSTTTTEKVRYELFGIYPDGTKQLMLGTGNYWGGFNVSGTQNQGQLITFGLTATIYPDVSIVSQGQYQDNIALDVVY